MKIYRSESYDAKRNAQRNLQGVTHYVDDDTLKYFHSRIVYSHEYFNGLLFGMVESCALDPDNRKRGFRGVVFDVSGNVIYRPDHEGTFKTSEKALKAMREFIKGLDIAKVTEEAIQNTESRYSREVADMRKELNDRKESAA